RGRAPRGDGGSFQGGRGRLRPRHPIGGIMRSARRRASPPRPAARGKASRKVRRPVGFESRPWGGFENIVEGGGYKVKRLTVEPGHRSSLQRHRFRAEHWVVVEGSPRVIVEGKARRLKARGAVDVPRGAWHRLENPGRRPALITPAPQGCSQ